MFELFWAVWVIPKAIYPIAKANNKSGFKWTLFSIGMFFSIELIILALYFVIYFSVSKDYKLPKNPEYFWLTYLVYFIALITGLLSIELLRRYLTKQTMVFKSIK